MFRKTLVASGSAALAVWFLISCIVSSVMPTVLWAQQLDQPDFEWPVIEHKIRNGDAIGGVEVFGATVSDNMGIERVSLFYRFPGETEFAELPMLEIASSSFFTAKVDTADVPEDHLAIEYYLRAEDTAGNVELRGFAFQPLLREFKPRPLSQVVAAPASPTTSTLSKVNWVYVALGVLVVGGAIAASGGGGGSGDNCADGCQVNLNFDPP